MKSSGLTDDKPRMVITAILQVWPRANIDRNDPAGVWSASVNDLSVEQIRHGIQLMSRSDDRYPLTPGQFRNLACTYRAPVTRLPVAITDGSQKSKAWRACQSRMASRLCGMAPPGEPKTEFNVDAVVDSVYWDDAERRKSIAEGFNAALHFDERVFKQLRQKFEGAWQ